MNMHLLLYGYVVHELIERSLFALQHIKVRAYTHVKICAGPLLTVDTSSAKRKNEILKLACE